MGATKKKRPAPAAVNPYGDHPISDYLVAANAGLSNLKPFSGAQDQLDVWINKMTGIGPQTKVDLDNERYEKMARSVPGAVTGGAIGIGANALFPMKAIMANAIMGGAEGATSDPEKGLSGPGAIFGTAMGSIPLLKFLKLDPRGLPLESFVRTLPAKTQELAGKLNIPEMIGEQLPRNVDIGMNRLQKLVKDKIPITLKDLLDPIKAFRKSRGPDPYETGARVLGLESRHLSSQLGNKSLIDPIAREAKDAIKRTEGVTLGTKAIATTAEAIPHEGIHAAIRAAAKKSGISSPKHIEDFALDVLDTYHGKVSDTVRQYILAKGYPEAQVSAEMLPHLQGILTNKLDRAMMIDMLFDGNPKAFDKWALGAKKAYREIVDWAKDIGPEDIKKYTDMKKKLSK